MDSKRKLAAVLALVAGILVTGTVGYRVIEHWSAFDSFYMTVITLSTVGYSEVYPLSQGGRAFTIALIFGGMGIVLYSFTEVTAFMIEGQLSGIWRRRKMNQQIQKLRGHYIICGAGRNGHYVLDELRRTKRDAVVVDRDEQKIEQLAQQGVLSVPGDATDDSVLITAGIGKAAGLVAALPNERDNLFVVITARGLNPSMRIISRIDDIHSRDKFLRSGADSAVSPKFMGGLRMASELVRPETVNFLDTMLRDNSMLRVEDLRVSQHSEVCGKAIAECSFLAEHGLLLVALGKENGFVFNPQKEETVAEGDTLIVIGTPDQLQQARFHL